MDGVIDAREWALLRNARLAHGIAAAEHRAAMLQEGVTPEMEDALWARGKDVVVAGVGARRARGGGVGFGAGVMAKVRAAQCVERIAQIQAQPHTPPPALARAAAFVFVVRVLKYRFLLTT